MANNWIRIKYKDGSLVCGKKPPLEVPVECELRHWLTNSIQEHELIRVDASDQNSVLLSRCFQCRKCSAGLLAMVTNMVEIQSRQRNLVRAGALYQAAAGAVVRAGPESKIMEKREKKSKTENSKFEALVLPKLSAIGTRDLNIDDRIE